MVMVTFATASVFALVLDRLFWVYVQYLIKKVIPLLPQWDGHQWDERERENSAEITPVR